MYQFPSLLRPGGHNTPHTPTHHHVAICWVLMGHKMGCASAKKRQIDVSHVTNVDHQLTDFARCTESDCDEQLAQGEKHTDTLVLEFVMKRNGI